MYIGVYEWRVKKRLKILGRTGRSGVGTARLMKYRSGPARKDDDVDRFLEMVRWVYKGFVDDGRVNEVRGDEVSGERCNYG